MCHAIQYSDTMMCGPCGLQWDTGDLDPPACSIGTKGLGKRTARPLAHYAAVLADPTPATVAAQVPAVLPPVLTSRMVSAYAARVMDGGTLEAAMQAAYRVFLGSLK